VNELLNYPPQVYERLQRVRDSEHDAVYLDQLVAHWKDPDNVPMPSDDAAEQWERYCLADGINLLRWAPCEWGGTAGRTLELTDRGVAALLMWERSQQVLPPDGAKLTEDEVPVQFRQDEDPDKDLLTAKYITGDESDWDLTNTDLSRYYGPGKPLTRRVKVGRQWVYLHRELKALRKAKTDRM
jgi:hypothetical protein